MPCVMPVEYITWQHRGGWALRQAVAYIGRTWVAAVCWKPFSIVFPQAPWLHCHDSPWSQSNNRWQPITVHPNRRLLWEPISPSGPEIYTALPCTIVLSESGSDFSLQSTYPYRSPTLYCHWTEKDWAAGLMSSSLCAHLSCSLHCRKRDRLCATCPPPSEVC